MNARLLFGSALLILASACAHSQQSVDEEMSKNIAKANRLLGAFDASCSKNMSPDELHACLRGAIAKERYDDVYSFCDKELKANPDTFGLTCAVFVPAAAAVSSNEALGNPFVKTVCDNSPDAADRVDYVAMISAVAFVSLHERSAKAAKEHEPLLLDRARDYADACKVPKEAVGHLVTRMGAEMSEKGDSSASCATTPACLEALEAANR